MQSESEISEFLALLKDTEEQLSYLKELGVDRIETATESSRQAEDSFANGSASAVKSAPTQDMIPKAAARARSKTPSAAAPTATLFGDVSAAPVRIQKSSESFEDIWSNVGDCTRCPLHQDRTNIVHTQGNRQARLMFVGEAPGADEDAQARPFVGRAGQLLTKIIEAIGLKREEVLIGNVNRCRPPGNRPPTPEEASMCKPFLLREIAAAQPEVIVVMGNTAMRNLLDIKQGITKVRGEFQDYQGVKVMPTFHPAYLLRDPSKKKETWEDLKKVRDYLDTHPKREH